MQKVNISDYDYQEFRPSIIVNTSNKPFWFSSYNANFYSHNFDDHFEHEDGYLEIIDNHYKQVSLSNIITESQGSSDYRVLNPKCIAFVLYSSVYWRPENPWKENPSFVEHANIYAGNQVNINSPEVYFETENRKMFDTYYFKNLSDSNKLELIRNFLPFWVYDDSSVAIKLRFNLQASCESSGIKSGQFIL